jgi:small GTP-binding protein
VTEKEVLTLVVCGEVDHGKSTLLGRLLWDTHSLPQERIAELGRICGNLGKGIEPAYLLDQFHEEREQERTIDTTQIFFKTRKRRYCLIDTPGHIEFVKNMMTGATQAEAALLVVDVCDGIRAQTLRHACLLKMFGISQIIVAVNKMDLAGFSKARFDGEKSGISGLLKKIGLKPRAIIPVVAKDGDNIVRASRRLSWHRGSTLIEAMSVLRGRKAATGAPLRFCVQDIYRHGAATICAGRVESGRLRVGQKVVALPCGQVTKIRAIKVFKGRRSSAAAGENIGLILNHSDRRRGEVLCSPAGKPAARTCFEGHIFWFGQKSLRVNEIFTLRCATQETKGVLACVHERMDSSTREILEKDGRQVKENDLARVAFRTETPLVMENFDCIESLGKFVLEDDTGVCGFGMKR